MAKKQKTSKSTVISKKSFNPENSPFFTVIAFVLLFIALVVLFNEFVFSDKMLHSSDTIQAGIFFRSYLVDSVLDSGHVPRWNPYIFGGMPYIEAFHGDIFYPLSFIKYIIPVYRAMGFLLFWHIFLAGIMMYFCARQFRLSKIASLMSAICYMFASYLVSMVAPGHDGKTYVTALFPLTILFIERAFNSATFLKTFFNFSMLGLVIGVIILSPHPQMSYYTLWAVSFYTAFKLISGYVKNRSVPGFIRPAMLTVYAVVIGLLVSAIQFYPGYIYTTDFSPRSDTKRGWEWATSWSLHEEEALSQLIPEFAGVNSSNPDYSRSTYYWGKNPFKDNSESVGVVAIFMALLGFFLVRRKESYFFGGLALFAFIYALGATTPVFKIFFYLIPKVKSLRAPSMIMFLFSFSIAILAGMAMQKIMDEGRRFDKSNLKRFRILLFGFPSLLLVLALLFSTSGKGMLKLWTSFFYSDAPRLMIQQGVSKLDIANLNLPAIQSGAWFSFLFVAVAALLIWLYHSGKGGAAVLCGLLLVPVVDGVRFNKRFVAIFDQDSLWSANPMTDFFKRTPGNYRVMNFASSMIQEDFLPHFGVEVIVGYHGNQLKWYDKLLGGPQKFNQGNPNFQNLAGAKYFVLPGNQNLPENYFGDKPVTQVANFGQIQIVQNDNALPRVFLVDKYKVFDSLDQVVETVLKGENVFRDTVYLEQEPSLTYQTDSLSSDSAWIVDYAADSVLVNASVTSNKILVMTDNYFDAWQVYVDGQKSPLMRSYGSFRAVELASGSREIKFKFESKRYKTGKIVTFSTSIYLLLVIGFYYFYWNRKEKLRT